MQIKAAILEKQFSKIYTKVKIAQKAKVDFVQIDICDGVLVDNKTFLSNARKDSAQKLARLCKNVNCELDMIVKAPDSAKWIDAILSIQPQKIIIHDKNINWNALFQTLSKFKIKIGLAIHIQDDLRQIKSLIRAHPFYYVQVMGIEKVGFGGQKLSPKTYTKIKAIRKTFPNIPISVDGGVKLENAEKLKQAGATELAIGSGIFKSKNTTETVRLLKQI